MPSNAKAATLTGAQLRHLQRVTDATNRSPERDRLVQLLGVTCAMRVTEIARVTVDDVFLPSGTVWTEVSLRAAITQGCGQRCVLLSHADTHLALDSYIEWRWTKGFGTELDRRRYRGLSPSTALVMTRRGAAYALNRKPRTLAGGEVEDYWSAMPCRPTSRGCIGPQAWPSAQAAHSTDRGHPFQTDRGQRSR